MAKIKLEKEQLEHVNRLIKILNHNPGCGDTSPCGAGKTITTLYLAQTLKLKLMVVCPKTLVNKWQKECDTYGIKPSAIISYGLLAGKKKCNHPWLTQNNQKYVVTEKFMNLAQKGVFLVFDEVQYVKNMNSKRAKAAFALVKVLKRTVSRSCFLSNTPIAKKDYSDAIVKIPGIVTREHMWIYDHASMKYNVVGHGLSELMMYCRRFDSKQVDVIKKKYPIDNSNKKLICFNLYSFILRNVIVSSMPEPNKKFKLTIYNAFYKMNTKSLNYIETGYKLIKKKIRNKGKSGFGTLAKAITLIEKGKLVKIEELIGERLNRDLNIKIIVYLCRKASMYQMKTDFEAYNPLVMNSDVIGKNRDDIITKFQRADNEYRLLITSAGVGGVGLDLDDQIGNFPREVYIVPTYKYIDDYQAARRVMRRFTRSDAKVYFVYSSDFPEEKILINQINKSDVHSEVVASSDDVVKTVEYETYYEQ